MQDVLRAVYLWKKMVRILRGLCLLGADTIIRRLSCATWKAPTPQGARGLLLIQLVISFTALELNWWTDGVVCGVLRRCLLGLLILYSGRWQNGVLIVPLRLTAWHRMTSLDSLWRPTHRKMHRVTEKERNDSCMESGSIDIRRLKLSASSHSAPLTWREDYQRCNALSVQYFLKSACNLQVTGISFRSLWFVLA